MSCYSSVHRTHSSGTKTCLCDNGYYDANVLLCQSCVSPCQTCNGGSILNCTSCISGYNLIGSSCNLVVTCSNQFYYQGFCLDSCPNITYPSSGSCISCTGYCMTCRSATVCTSCASPFYLLANGTCLGHCPQGTYAKDGSCLNCPTGCQSCVFRSSIGQVYCISCLSSYYYDGYLCTNTCPIALKTHIVA